MIEPQQIRYRSCDSPEPQYGGKQCIGTNKEQKSCEIPICAIDGRWSRWTPWSECSATCGNGIQIRYRKCNNPMAEYGGRNCEGHSNETIACTNKPCAINGGWSEWSEWSECNKKCGLGQKYRRRECNNPKPSSDGSFCIGPALETIGCKNRPCEPAISIDQYRPLVTYSDSKITLSGEYDEDIDDKSENTDNYHYIKSNEAYSLRRPDEHVKLNDVFDTPRKVTVEVESFMPLNEDISQIRVNLKGELDPLTM